MKSCLKCSSAPGSGSAASASFAGPSACASSGQCKTPNSRGRPPCSRQVSFRDKCEYEVHTADDWDRSPVDISRNLSYEDILELKQMQVEAAKAQARQHGTSSRYLPKVPLSVVPLLAPSSSSSSGPSKSMGSSNYTSGPAGMRIPTPSAVGLALSEACLCRMLSADSGSGASRSERCALHGPSARKPIMHSPQPSRDGSKNHIPSPPHTPPRPTITSLPHSSPPPPSRLKNFGFVPLLGNNSEPPAKKEAETKHGLITPPLSAKPSWTQLAPQTTSANTYRPNYPMVGNNNSLGLGLERKLGFSFGNSPQSSSESDSESEEEANATEEDETDWRLKEIRSRELKQRKERMSSPPRRTWTRLS